MADEPQQAVPGMADITKVDAQTLLQSLMQAHREIAERRRAHEKDLAAERERSRVEIGRFRKEWDTERAALLSENEALVRALGRQQADVDRLHEENAVLRHKGGCSVPGADPFPHVEAGVPPVILRSQTSSLEANKVPLAVMPPFMPLQQGKTIAIVEPPAQV